MSIDHNISHLIFHVVLQLHLLPFHSEAARITLFLFPIQIRNHTIPSIFIPKLFHLNQQCLQVPCTLTTGHVECINSWRVCQQSLEVPNLKYWDESIYQLHWHHQGSLQFLSSVGIGLLEFTTYKHCKFHEHSLWSLQIPWYQQSMMCEWLREIKIYYSDLSYPRIKPGYHWSQ